MKIAVLSGKGGTGKTFVSVNLSKMLGNCVYLDCDVEEPNGKIFLDGESKVEEKVTVLIPEFDEKLCTGCRQCVYFCKFGALFYLRGKPKLITDMCHSCGGCSLVCPNNAIAEVSREVGIVEKWNCDGIDVAEGTLNLGEASAVPVIQAVKKAYPESDKNIVIDCPPGSSCSVMEAMSGCDVCVIVTEPTSFGFENFKTVFNLTRVLGIPCCAVLNKYEFDYLPFDKFCEENGVAVIAKIPFKKELAKDVSEGKIAVESDLQTREIFASLVDKIKGVSSL